MSTIMPSAERKNGNDGGAIALYVKILNRNVRMIVIYMSPDGELFDQPMANQLSLTKI